MDDFYTKPDYYAKKLMYGSVLFCIVLWIIAIPNMDYFFEFMIKDTYFIIQYTLIPVFISCIVAVVIFYSFIKKNIAK